MRLISFPFKTSLTTSFFLPVAFDENELYFLFAMNSTEVLDVAYGIDLNNQGRLLHLCFVDDIGLLPPLRSFTSRRARCFKRRRVEFA